MSTGSGDAEFSRYAITITHGVENRLAAAPYDIALGIDDPTARVVARPFVVDEVAEAIERA